MPKNKPKRTITKRESTQKLHTKPNDWNEVWDEILTMRKERNAAVDIMGAHKSAASDAPENEQRFQLLIGCLLSSQTKDEQTQKAVSQLKQNIGLNVSAILKEGEERIDKLISMVGFHKTKAKNWSEDGNIVHPTNYWISLWDLNQNRGFLTNIGLKLMFYLWALAIKPKCNICTLSDRCPYLRSSSKSSNKKKQKVIESDEVNINDDDDIVGEEMDNVTVPKVIADIFSRISVDVLRELKKLDLSKRSLKAVPKLNAFQNVVELDISHNNVQRLRSKNILMDLPNLQKFDLSFNELFVFGDIAQLGIHPHLRSISIHGNPLPLADNRIVLIAALLLGEESAGEMEKRNMKYKAEMEAYLASEITLSPDQQQKKKIIAQKQWQQNDVINPALHMNEKDESNPSQVSYIPEKAVKDIYEGIDQKMGNKAAQFITQDILGHQWTPKTSHQTNEQGEQELQPQSLIASNQGSNSLNRQQQNKKKADASYTHSTDNRKKSLRDPSRAANIFLTQPSLIPTYDYMNTVKTHIALSKKAKVLGINNQKQDQSLLTSQNIGNIYIPESIQENEEEEEKDLLSSEELAGTAQIYGTSPAWRQIEQQNQEMEIERQKKLKEMKKQTEIKNEVFKKQTKQAILQTPEEKDQDEHDINNPQSSDNPLSANMLSSEYGRQQHQSKSQRNQDSINNRDNDENEVSIRKEEIQTKTDDTFLEQNEYFNIQENQQSAAQLKPIKNNNMNKGYRSQTPQPSNLNPIRKSRLSQYTNTSQNKLNLTHSGVGFDNPPTKLIPVYQKVNINQNRSQNTKNASKSKLQKRSKSSLNVSRKNQANVSEQQVDINVRQDNDQIQDNTQERQQSADQNKRSKLGPSFLAKSSKYKKVPFIYSSLTQGRIRYFGFEPGIDKPTKIIRTIADITGREFFYTDLNAAPVPRKGPFPMLIELNGEPITVDEYDCAQRYMTEASEQKAQAASPLVYGGIDRIKPPSNSLYSAGGPRPSQMIAQHQNYKSFLRQSKQAEDELRNSVQHFLRTGEVLDKPGATESLDAMKKKRDEQLQKEEEKIKVERERKRRITRENEERKQKQQQERLTRGVKGILVKSRFDKPNLNISSQTKSQDLNTLRSGKDSVQSLGSTLSSKKFDINKLKQQIKKEDDEQKVNKNESNQNEDNNDIKTNQIKQSPISPALSQSPALTIQGQQQQQQQQPLVIHPPAIAGVPLPSATPTPTPSQQQQQLQQEQEQDQNKIITPFITSSDQVSLDQLSQEDRIVAIQELMEDQIIQQQVNIQNSGTSQRDPEQQRQQILINPIAQVMASMGHYTTPDYQKQLMQQIQATQQQAFDRLQVQQGQQKIENSLSSTIKSVQQQDTQNEQKRPQSSQSVTKDSVTLSEKLKLNKNKQGESDKDKKVEQKLVISDALKEKLQPLMHHWILKSKMRRKQKLGLHKFNVDEELAKLDGQIAQGSSRKHNDKSPTLNSNQNIMKKNIADIYAEDDDDSDDDSIGDEDDEDEDDQSMSGNASDGSGGSINQQSSSVRRTSNASINDEKEKKRMKKQKKLRKLSKQIGITGSDTGSDGMQAIPDNIGRMPKSLIALYRLSYLPPLTKPLSQLPPREEALGFSVQPKDEPDTENEQEGRARAYTVAVGEQLKKVEAQMESAADVVLKAKKLKGQKLDFLPPDSKTRQYLRLKAGEMEPMPVPRVPFDILRQVPSFSKGSMLVQPPQKWKSYDVQQWLWRIGLGQKYAETPQFRAMTGYYLITMQDPEDLRLELNVQSLEDRHTIWQEIQIL
ncbi:MAG: hypothetical protein EZS28_008014, partial [Streblomastix strix]